MWCNGFSEIYGQLEEGVGSICHGILLHVKLLWCMGLPWVYVHCALCQTYGVQQCSMDLWSIGKGGVMV